MWCHCAWWLQEGGTEAIARMYPSDQRIEELVEEGMNEVSPACYCYCRGYCHCVLSPERPTMRNGASGCGPACLLVQQPAVTHAHVATCMAN